MTRTVTNVGRTSETYTASVDGVRGVAVSVSRPSFTLRPGESTTYDVTFSARQGGSLRSRRRRSADLEGFARTPRPDPGRRSTRAGPRPGRAPGSGDHRRPADLRCRRRDRNSVSRLSRPGRCASGRLRASTGSFDVAKPSSSSSTKADTFSVPAGSSLARVEVRGASPGDDLDLYLYRKGDLVAQSVNHGGDETITLTNPRPGAYTAYVHASAATGDLTIGSVTGWVLDAADRPAADDRNDQITARLSVGPSPVQVTGGRRFGVDLSWRGLDLSRRWLAVIRYDDSDRNTVLTVN